MRGVEDLLKKRDELELKAEASQCACEVLKTIKMVESRLPASYGDTTLLEKTKIFADIKKFTKAIEDGNFIKARVVQTFLSKVESLNPIILANQAWQQSLIQEEDRIGFFNKNQGKVNSILCGT